jgi:hypothetical protein
MRLSLTVFMVGFGAESASGFAALVSNSSQLPFHGILILLSPAFTVLGLLFLWVGRHEWNEVHRTRVRYANGAFAVTILATALAAGPIVYLAVEGIPTAPGWVALEFGGAVALVFAITFVTYALVAAHLVGRLGEVAMGVGLAWAALISALIGLALSARLGTIVGAVSHRTISVGPIFDPITLLDALLAFSYLAFFLAFADAHYRVAKGIRMAGD